MEKNDVLISVCTITYKHSNFIAKAIESVIAQQCSYKIEMIISDDCSPDNTADIIRSYAEKYPDIIKPIYNEKNLGAQKNNIQALTACKGKYIAGLEGDDYWIDPYKLQKQADFLEAHPDFSMCFTGAEILDEMGTANKIYASVDKDVFTFEDFVVPFFYFVPTPTIVFRNYGKPPDFVAQSIAGDIALHLLLAGNGKIKRLSDITAVYRHHAGGVSKSAEFEEKLEDDLYYLYEQADKYFKYKYHSIFRDHLLARIKTRLIYGSKDLKGMKKLKHVIKISKQYFFYSDKINFKEVVYYSAILFSPIILKIKKANKQ